MNRIHSVLIVFVFAGCIWAGEYHWTNNSPAWVQYYAVWNNAGNWQEAAFPDSAGDRAFFTFPNDTGSLHLDLGQDITVGSISIIESSNNSIYLEGNFLLTFDNGTNAAVWERTRDIASGNALRMEVSCNLHLASDLQATWQVQRDVPLSGTISGPGSLTVNYRQQRSDTDAIEFEGSNPNTYSGGTLLNGDSDSDVNETFTASKNGAFGTGDLELNAYAVVHLTDQGSVDDMIDDGAAVRLAKSGESYARMALDPGVSETVNALVLNGVEQFAGTYGADGSGAQVIKNDYFSGTGILTVLSGPPGPGGISNGDGASDIMAHGAVLNGVVLYTNSSPTLVSIFWGAADGGMTKTAWENEIPLGIHGPGPVTTIISNGVPLQTLYYRCYITNALGELWAAPSEQFKLHGPPEVQNERVVLLPDSVVLRGTVLGTNGYTTVAWFCWGTVDGGMDTGSWEHRAFIGTVTNGSLAHALSNLTEDAQYYYRVYATNGFGTGWADSTASFIAPGEPATNDITFFCISDIHYGLTPEIDTFAQSVVDSMNELPGMAYPAGLESGIVQPPRGVVVAGDTTERGAEDEWAMFTRDYGLHGDGRLAYPVYEGYGNHDGSTYAVGQMKSRTTQRNGLRRISSNGMHYSWDWDYLHLIHLNVSPGFTYSPYDPRFSYTFLTNDLAESVGNSDRPVIIFHHFGYDSSSLTWWPAQDRTNFFEAIALYNVAAVVHGHSHRTGFYKRDGIDICNTPHTEKAENTPLSHGFLVFHISSNTLTVATRSSSNTWEATLQKSIAVPEPTGMLYPIVIGLLSSVVIKKRK